MRSLGFQGFRAETVEGVEIRARVERVYDLKGLGGSGIVRCRV